MLQHEVKTAKMILIKDTQLYLTLTPNEATKATAYLQTQLIKQCLCNTL